MDLMDTMLAELENLDLQAANISINELGQNRNISGTRVRGISRFQSRPMMRGPFSGNASRGGETWSVTNRVKPFQFFDF